MTVISESEQIDLELRQHYERAVRGSGCCPEGGHKLSR